MGCLNFTTTYRITGHPESAGINRHAVGDERALQERKAANPLSAESGRVPGYQSTRRSWTNYSSRIVGSIRQWPDVQPDPHSICLSLRGLGQRQRSLAKHISPSCRGAHISVAEPKRVFEWLSVLRTFRPQFSSDNRRIAPNANRLCTVVLPFIEYAPTPRFVEQISF